MSPTRPSRPRRQADVFLEDLSGETTLRLLGSSVSEGVIAGHFGEVTQDERDQAELFFEALSGMPSAAFESLAEDVQLVAPFSPPLDAAIVWPNGSAYFFKGDKYVRYAIDPEGAASDYPKKIKDHWPGLWERDIDAAVVWNENTAYFFKGAEFIKYSIAGTEGAQPGYPMKIKDHWPGLWERDIDAAVVWNNGMAYFFRCRKYIGSSMDGRTANAPRSIKHNWKDLVGGPTGWRRDRFPPRPGGAPKGRALFESLGTAAEREKTPPTVAAWVRREEAMVAQLISGNMPDSLLRWVEIDVSRTLTEGPAKGRAVSGKVWVLPDYLAIGDDTDYVYAPLDPWSAQRVASSFGAVLPTARICHAIYTSASSRKIRMIARDYWRTDSGRVVPRGRTQDSTAAYLEHSSAIRDEMTKAPAVAVGTLVAGHKKDVVLSAKLHPTPTSDESARIAYHGFYDAGGWPTEPCYHTSDGKLNKTIPKDKPALAHPMQPNGHLFSDYSQGVRLVHPMMKADDEWVCVAQVLGDPELSYLISFEGPIDPARIPKPTLPMGGGIGI
jgi:hypothetical protein